MGEINEFSNLCREVTLFDDIYTLSELKKIDIWNAFAEWITVKEAISTGVIPSGFESLSPTHCKCGAERIIKYSLTEFTCVNPKCPIKRAFTMEKIFKSFGVDGIGEKTCAKILENQRKQSEEDTIFDILTNTEFDEDDYGEATYLKIMQGIGKIERSKLTFQELMKVVGVPGVEEKATEIFSRYSNIDEVLDDIDKYGTTNFYRVNGTESPMIMFKISSYMKEVMSAYKMLCGKGSLIRFSGDSLEIVMTNSINGFSSRPEYIKFLNDMVTLPNGYRVLTVKASKSRETTEYFVIDDFSKSSKTIVRAREREEEEGRKLIYSSEEFSGIMYQLRLQYTEEEVDG